MEKLYNLKHKIFNYCFSKKFLKRILQCLPSSIYYFGPPKVFNIEISTQCNLSCIGCYNNKIEKESKRFIELSTVEKLATAIKKINHKAKIYLFNHGEPLLHPQIFEILDIFISKGINNLYIDSNFSMPLSQETLDRLKKISELNLVISVDTFDEESSFRKGFDKLVFGKNIRALMKDDTHCAVTAQILVGKHNEHEAISLIEWFRSFDINNIKMKHINMDREDDCQSIVDYKKKTSPCCFAFWGMAIDVFGKTQVCCNNRKLVDLDLNSWTSVKFRRIRKENFLCDKKCQ